MWWRSLITIKFVKFWSCIFLLLDSISWGKSCLKCISSIVGWPLPVPPDPPPAKSARLWPPAFRFGRPATSPTCGINSRHCAIILIFLGWSSAIFLVICYCFFFTISLVLYAPLPPYGGGDMSIMLSCHFLISMVGSYTSSKAISHWLYFH